MGNLLDELKSWYTEENYPPDGPELGDNVRQVSWRVIDTSGRLRRRRF